ncbi:TrkH family potassium uptake protein [Pseudodesulfovibrio tunisiensis]|uniref:TrkH family potassium uptake protein n=1 Tax=Pseudodesulfovibrio tunisiensis TaxID=463192 RepID=UPI001FB29B21|nr:TrkH family potassium uptake protein [Pseudodesulfovibrio tunisiensis]
MRWKYVLHIIGALVACVGLTMLWPLLWAVYYDDGSAGALALALSVSVVSGAALFFLFRNPDYSRRPMSHREGMAIVALGWFAAGLAGGLPFFFDGTFDLFVDCVFESLSGFSTTGASVLSDIEAVPRGILFWRSLTHWLGGMGIIVLSLAILPFLGVGGMQLYKAEVPGPVPDKLKPKIKDTAMTLWKVYVLFSILETMLLMIGGMDLFDSLCHTFGTMATGGFSTKNTSVAYFDSAYIDYVITIFMFIAGVNFSLHYLLLKGRPKSLIRDPEFRVFAAMMLGFTVIITIAVLMNSNYENVPDAIRYTSFQVASILTTTGFATADYELWPGLAQAILLFCMFVGGCAGSTGGGMKVMRMMLILKQSYQELFRLIHPRAISRIKMGRTVVQDDVMSGVWGFFILWLGLLTLAAFVVAASGVDVVTSFASSLACIGNIGPGIGGVGPTDNYAWLPETAKWALTFCMVLGRLEIYTVIILFVPEFWRK